MTRKKKNTHTHKQNFATHPVPGQSRTFVYAYVFFPERESVECWISSGNHGNQGYAENHSGAPQITGSEIPDTEHTIGIGDKSIAYPMFANTSLINLK